MTDKSGVRDLSSDEYLTPWSGRLRGSFLEMTILYHTAYSTEIYPYSIKKQLDIKWGELSPPLPTIYSTIKRLEKAGYIKTTNEIINSRVQRRIEIQDKGFEALDYMEKHLERYISAFELHKEEFELKRRKKK